eukprot:1675912-Amphidinium_carterae.1
MVNCGGELWLMTTCQLNCLVRQGSMLEGKTTSRRFAGAHELHKQLAVNHGKHNSLCSSSSDAVMKKQCKTYSALEADSWNTHA